MVGVVVLSNFVLFCDDDCWSLSIGYSFCVRMNKSVNLRAEFIEYCVFLGADRNRVTRFSI